MEQRARWADKAELKQVVQSVDPDVLCFLEGKTDAENLLRLPHFREWVAESRFRQMNCYWSLKDDQKGFGNEGLILFSKIPCEVKYGIGDKTLDKQARAMTVEFSDCIMLFTYNPQGGFSEDSLAFRTRWEEALTTHIRTVSLDALLRKKKMIWAGDLNVNPTSADWSMRAFDRIKHRIPKGAAPTGCREVDQEAYRNMVHNMNGVNVAEHFGKQSIRTCFQSEDHLRKNYGQRIDHVIADASLLNPESELHITAFDTLIQFGASRKSSSDHCPLWFKLERGHNAPVLTVQTEATPGEKLDEPLTTEIKKLMAPPQFRNVEPTAEFENYSSDEENDAEWDDIACAAFKLDDYLDATSNERCEDEEVENDEDHIACNASEAQPFEDCSSPILQVLVRGTNSVDRVPAKVLVDSGSTLDLVSGKMARKLQRLGHSMHEIATGVRIKVANGRKSVLNQAMMLQLIVHEEHTEPIEWLVLEDLPFDMILGSKTCKRWKAVVDWGKSRFTMTPNEKEIAVDWNVYRGQHWRRPVVLTAKETVTIPPHSQTTIEVSNDFRESEGYACKAGLVTPVREQAVLTQKFAVAYMYGEDVTRIAVANMTSSSVTITGGTAVAEFHPRSRESIDFESYSTGRSAGSNHDRRALGSSIVDADVQMRNAAIEHGAISERQHYSCSALQPPLSPIHEQAQCAHLMRQEGGRDNEPSHAEDSGGTSRIQACQSQVLGPTTCSNWEAEFDTDPLKSVDISHLARERTVEEAKKLKHLLWEIKDTLSDRLKSIGARHHRA